MQHRREAMEGYGDKKREQEEAELVKLEQQRVAEQPAGEAL